MLRHIILLLFICTLFCGSIYAQRWDGNWRTIQLDDNVSLQLPSKSRNKLSNWITGDKTVATRYEDGLYFAAYTDITKIAPKVPFLIDSFIKAGYTRNIATDSVRRRLYNDYVQQESTDKGAKISQVDIKIDSVAAKGYVYFMKNEFGDMFAVAKSIVYSNGRLYSFETRTMPKADNYPWLKLMSSIHLSKKD